MFTVVGSKTVYQIPNLPHFCYSEDVALPKWATTVTPFSKMLALSMLIIFPCIGFVLGMQYQQARILSQEQIVAVSPRRTTYMANPASVYCKKQGGKSEIITAPDGSQSGQCIFTYRKTCDEWQFFRTKVCR